MKSKTYCLCWILLPCAAALIGAGCGSSNSSSTSGDVHISGSGGTVTAGGVTISYPSSFHSKGTSIQNNNVTLEFDNHRILVKDGKLTVDDKSYGPVTKGDTVKVEEDGSVLINSAHTPVQSQ